MPAPKSVEDAKIVVEGWIVHCQGFAIQEPKKAASLLRSRAAVLENMGEEHMPEGWGFGGPELIQKLRQAARDIQGAAQ